MVKEEHYWQIEIFDFESTTFFVCWKYIKNKNYLVLVSLITLFKLLGRNLYPGFSLYWQKE
jgi:hypothetical protein